MTRLLRPILLVLALLALQALPPMPIPKAHAAAGMVGILANCHSAAPSLSATNYNGFTNGPTPWQAGETANEACFGGDGTWTVANWRIQLDVAPGAAASGKSYTFTIRKNEADTALVVTIADAATAGSDLTDTATFSPGDRIGVKCVPSGTNPTGATTHVNWSVNVTAPSANEFPILWSSAQTHTDTANTQYYYEAANSGFFASPETDVQCVCPTAGTISKLYVDLDADPGNGHVMTVKLRQATPPGAAADTALVATVTGNVGGTSKTGNDTTHSVTVAAGDLLDWSIKSDAGSNAVRTRLGALFAPTVNGESVCWWDGSPFAQNSTNYYCGAGGSSTTEALAETPVPACVLKKLYLDTTSRTPAAGQTLTYTLNDATVSTGITCQGTNGAPTANDTTHTYSEAAGGLIDLKMVSSLSAGLTSAKYSFVLYVAPATGTSNLPLLGVGAKLHPPFFPRFD